MRHPNMSDMVVKVKIWR